MKKKISKIWMPIVICLVLIANIAVFATNSTLTAEIPLVVESMNYIPLDAPTDIDYGVEMVNIGEMVIERNDSVDTRALAEQLSWGDNLFEVTSAEIWHNDGTLALETLDDCALDMTNYDRVTERSLVQFRVSSLNVIQAGNAPLQANAPTQIEFWVENNGMSGVHNPTVSLFSNEQLIGTLILTNFFPGNAEGLFALTLHSGFPAGLHNIRVTVIGGGSSGTIVRPFTFQGGAANLQVAAITRSTVIPAITIRAQEYSVRITNVGSGRAADHTPSDIHVNNQLLGRLSIPWLNPGDSVTFTFNITFAMRGSYTVRASTLHNYRALVQFIDFDTELFAGRWSNARSLIVSATPATRSNFTTAQLESYLAWNGITSNVSLNRLVDPTFDAHIKMFTGVHPEAPGLLGWVNLFRSGSHQLELITDPLRDPSNYVFAEVVIRPDLRGDMLTGTIIHEFGHALGLAHTECLDLSVMAAFPSLPNATNQIMPHDRHNLTMRYR
ncbi:MAG: hypothetical protein FWE29_05705 [Defluviitaleaceae bacterium]|nr:hypothetical protein [Defluviitaleaceae bacterium]